MKSGLNQMDRHTGVGLDRDIGGILMELTLSRGHRLEDAHQSGEETVNHGLLDFRKKSVARVRLVMFEWLIGSESPPPALDEAYLVRLRRHVGTDAIGELIDDGVLELSAKLDHLAEQAGSGDIKHIASVCHDIAGAAGNLGLTAMTRAAVESNRMGLADKPPPADELVAHVVGCRAPAFDALAAFRAGQSVNFGEPETTETAQEVP